MMITLQSCWEDLYVLKIEDPEKGNNESFDSEILINETYFQE